MGYMANASPLSRPRWRIFKIKAYGDRRGEALEEYLGDRDEVAEARVDGPGRRLVARLLAGTEDWEVEDAAAQGGFPIAASKEPMDSADGRLGILSLALAAIATAVSFLGTYYDAVTGDYALILGAFIVFICGYPLLKNAITALFDKKFGSELVMAMAILAPLPFSYQTGQPFYYASGIVVLISQAANILSRYVEPRFQGLGFFLPARAMSGEGEWVATDSLKPGDLFRVKAGFRAPLDGTVTAGEGLAVVPGSCVGARLREGSAVVGGALMMEGTVTVKAKEKGEPRLRRAAAAFAAARKPIDVLLSYPKSIERALLLVVIMGVGFVVVFMGNFMAAAAILIAAAPAAALIARPISLIACDAAASRHGAGFMSHGAIERMSMTDAVAFDGLGAVAGSASLAGTSPAAGHAGGEVEAAVSAYRGGDPTFMDARGMGGYSLVCLADASRLAAVPEELLSRARAFEGRGLLVRYAFKDEALLGVAAFELAVPEGMRASVERLGRMGIKNVMLLAAEPAAVAEDVARKAGIGIVKPRLEDDERLEFIRKLGADGKNVLAAGRGCESSRFAANAAAVTVNEQALGFEGLEDAICASPADVAGLVELAKKEVKRASEGMSFGFYFNTIAVIAASTTLVDVELVLLMVAASVVAIATNSARLYFTGLH